MQSTTSSLEITRTACGILYTGLLALVLVFPFITRRWYRYLPAFTVYLIASLANMLAHFSNIDSGNQWWWKWAVPMEILRLICVLEAFTITTVGMPWGKRFAIYTVALGTPQAVSLIALIYAPTAVQGALAYELVLALSILIFLLLLWNIGWKVEPVMRRHCWIMVTLLGTRIASLLLTDTLVARMTHGAIAHSNWMTIACLNYIATAAALAVYPLSLTYDHAGSGQAVRLSSPALR